MFKLHLNDFMAFCGLWKWPLVTHVQNLSGETVTCNHSTNWIYIESLCYCFGSDHVHDSFHRHMNCVSHIVEYRAISAGIEAQMSAQCAPGRRRRNQEPWRWWEKNRAWQGGLASISGSLCAPRWRAARCCVARRKTALSGRSCTVRRTQPSTISTIHLQLSIICSLLPQIWDWYCSLLPLCTAPESAVTY